jgi:hypothetical protein
VPLRRHTLLAKVFNYMGDERGTLAWAFLHRTSIGCVGALHALESYTATLERDHDLKLVLACRLMSDKHKPSRFH